MANDGVICEYRPEFVYLAYFVMSRVFASEFFYCTHSFMYRTRMHIIMNAQRTNDDFIDFTTHTN